MPTLKSNKSPAKSQAKLGNNIGAVGQRASPNNPFGVTTTEAGLTSSNTLLYIGGAIVLVVVILIALKK